MSAEVPDVAVHVERGPNRIAGGAVSLLACAAIGVVIGVAKNEHDWDRVQQEHVAIREGYLRCAEYVGTLTQDRKQSPITEDPFGTMTAGVISDCRVPGRPEDYNSDPTNPHTTIVTVKFPSLDVLDSVAQTEERKAAAAERTMEGTGLHAGGGALGGTLAWTVGAGLLARRRTN